jgi:uncharacterized protein with von Willebrand factor type A (vWA) domain
MRTTVDLPDALLRELKAKAALEGTTLKHLVLALVEQGLRGTGDKSARRSKRSPLPTLGLNHPLAIRNFTNARLFEMMDD